MIKYYIQNNERHSIRHCKCNDDTALFILSEKHVNGKYVGFWKCKNCSSKQPYKPHIKFFNLL